MKNNSILFFLNHCVALIQVVSEGLMPERKHSYYKKSKELTLPAILYPY